MLRTVRKRFSSSVAQQLRGVSQQNRRNDVLSDICLKCKDFIRKQSPRLLTYDHDGRVTYDSMRGHGKNFTIDYHAHHGVWHVVFAYNITVEDFNLIRNWCEEQGLDGFEISLGYIVIIKTESDACLMRLAF